MSDKIGDLGTACVFDSQLMEVGNFIKLSDGKLLIVTEIDDANNRVIFRPATTWEKIRYHYTKSPLLGVVTGFVVLAVIVFLCVMLH